MKNLVVWSCRAPADDNEARWKKPTVLIAPRLESQAISTCEEESHR
jgi:hypothetical protein